MTHITIRETTRLLMLAFGVLFALVAVVSGFSLVCAQTEHGVVEFHSTLVRGEPINVAIVVWGNGVVLWLEPGDLPVRPTAGDTITVLAIGKGGMLKSGRSFWKAWKWTGSFAMAGVALIIGGMYVLRHQPSPHEIGVTQAV